MRIRGHSKVVHKPPSGTLLCISMVCTASERLQFWNGSGRPKDNRKSIFYGQSRNSSHCLHWWTTSMASLEPSPSSCPRSPSPVPQPSPSHTAQWFPSYRLNFSLKHSPQVFLYFSSLIAYFVFKTFLKFHIFPTLLGCIYPLTFSTYCTSSRWSSPMLTFTLHYTTL